MAAAVTDRGQQAVARDGLQPRENGGVRCLIGALSIFNLKIDLE